MAFPKGQRPKILPVVGDRYERCEWVLSACLHFSLHDPHVREFYLNNPGARNHLVSAGLITEDVCVLGSPHELREGAKVPDLVCFYLSNIKLTQGIPTSDGARTTAGAST